MGRFDFIRDKDFRASLESDYRELNIAKEHAAWKAVHVLAGSIIEAVLLDFLNSSDYQSRTHKDPNKMTLSELISACKDERALSSRSADLSSVVRDYRNLIHPGRIVRLKESVDQNGATVAAALIEIIVSEVESSKKAAYGITAEQIVAKIEHDTSAASIIEHLLKDVKAGELERLLISVLPNKYLEYRSEYEDPFATSTSAAYTIMVALSDSFRHAFEYAPDDVKRTAASNFVRIIKEEAKHTVFAYEGNLFRPTDLQYLDVDNMHLVKQHLLSRLDTDESLDTGDYLHLIEGLGEWLEEGDWSSFVHAAMEMLNRHASFIAMDIEEFANALEVEFLFVPQKRKASVLGSLDEWKTWFADHDRKIEVSIVQRLRGKLEGYLGDLDLPF